VEKLVLVVVGNPTLFISLLREIKNKLKGKGWVKVLGCLNIPNPRGFFGKRTGMLPDILVIDESISMYSEIMEAVSETRPEVILPISSQTNVLTLLEEIDDAVSKKSPSRQE